MNKNNLQIWAVLLCLLITVPAQSRVYRNKKVGKYSSSFHLANHSGQSLLSFIKKELYPAIKSQADNRSRKNHVSSIAMGEGVELRLTSDVSTYHVKYKKKGEEKAERSGRSFGALGTPSKARYLADASYKHYLSTLERALKNPVQAELFYDAILRVLIDSDPAGINNLKDDTKKVAADFVAVYIAEQYRRMIAKDGKALARRPEWDNAHLHVTLLANFHAGQSQPGMYYHGKYQTRVYHQIERKNGKKVCAYRDRKNSLIQLLRTRSFNMTDYWQFNAECERSGVNITRRDFVKMSRNITKYMNKQSDFDTDLEDIHDFTNKNVAIHKNINDALVDYIVSDKAPNVYPNSDELVDAIVNYLMLMRENADPITGSL